MTKAIDVLRRSKTDEMEMDEIESGVALETGLYRSGRAARLAGLSVETLRVWERRYGVSAPQRSAHGQRLYSGEQVYRLGLIRQLVEQGHPISAVAGLTVDRLQKLAEPLVSLGNARKGPIRVVLVGEGLVRRVTNGGLANLALDVVNVGARLDAVSETLRNVNADVLVIEAPELNEDAVSLIIEMRQVTGVAAVVVVYRFCAAPTLRSLRAQGYLVARMPADLTEIVLLCDTALAAQSGHSRRVDAAPWPNISVLPRRLDDQALATLVAAANSVACECPRHLAEILLMLNSFERYSQQCSALSPDDALVHDSLTLAVSQARGLLESAMERLALAEGLPLPAGLQR
ncbi:MerR family transcriptional regulator [Glaciimonas sp. CA11.2]|uniref:MerR family transcriptional regulator n=1 Tax=Glaciimonas sp. CA11.2 TaxID=3048601 RepID=UPI002AB34504|nr:MerR family transcriptional regulator [Glaciimonas sp. CA11.2]MDY7545669.1 MerR family transcriptional regulator [Glaciimonas sp. CA11.2]MEB0161485.1 MerR family transcriptional regulator [Glaciimonas sp. CA11.2]